MTEQLALPLPAQTRRVGVAPTLYDAILHLRRAGMRVHAAGVDHIVDGRRLNDRELYLVAESVGFDGVIAPGGLDRTKAGGYFPRRR